MEEALEELTQYTEVPNVFVNGEHIGGHREVDEMGVDMIKSMIDDKTEDLKEEIFATVNENQVVMYTKSWCPDSRHTKEQFDEAGIEYKEVVLDKREDGKEMQEVLYELTDYNEVPNVFVNGEHIGGHRDVDRMGVDAVKRMISGEKMSLKEEILATVAEHKVVVYSKSWCPDSRYTKKQLNDAGIEHKVIELDLIEDGKNMERALEKLTKYTEVPNVFVNGEHIGGRDEVDEIGVEAIRRMIGQD